MREHGIGGSRVVGAPLSMTITAFPSGWASARSWPSTWGGRYFSNRASLTGYTVGAGKLFQASRRLMVSSMADGAMFRFGCGTEVQESKSTERQRGMECAGIANAPARGVTVGASALD